MPSSPASWAAWAALRNRSAKSSAVNDPTNFGGSQNCAGVSIAAGSSCQFTYTFTPTTPGPWSSSTTIDVDDQSFSITLAGTAVDASATTTTSTPTTTTTATTTDHHEPDDANDIVRPVRLAVGLDHTSTDHRRSTSDRAGARSGRQRARRR